MPEITSLCGDYFNTNHAHSQSLNRLIITRQALPAPPVMIHHLLLAEDKTTLCTHPGSFCFRFHSLIFIKENPWSDSCMQVCSQSGNMIRTHNTGQSRFTCCIWMQLQVHVVITGITKNEAKLPLWLVPSSLPPQTPLGTELGCFGVYSARNCNNYSVITFNFCHNQIHDQRTGGWWSIRLFFVIDLRDLVRLHRWIPSRRGWRTDHCKIIRCAVNR